MKWLSIIFAVAAFASGMKAAFDWYVASQVVPKPTDVSAKDDVQSVRNDLFEASFQLCSHDKICDT